MKTPEEYFKLTPSTGLINESHKMADNIYSQVKLIISKMEDMHNTFIVNRDKLEEYVQLRIKEAQQQVSVEPEVSKPTEAEEWFANTVIGYIKSEQALADRDKREFNTEDARDYIVRLLREMAC